MDINSENRDEIIFSYIEGLMDDKEKAEFEALLQKDDSLWKDVAIFKRTSFVVAEPLSSIEDMSRELAKPTFSLKWLWAGLAGFLLVIGGVYAIFLFQSSSMDNKESKSEGVTSKDSVSTGMSQSERSVYEDSAEKVDFKIDTDPQRPKVKQELTKMSKDTIVTSLPQSLPVDTQEKLAEVPKVEDKKMQVADTLSKTIGLKVTSVSEKDSVQAKKVAPAIPKGQKPKSVKKLNIKGTEDIKTNSSLY